MANTIINLRPTPIPNYDRPDPTLLKTAVNSLGKAGELFRDQANKMAEQRFKEEQAILTQANADRTFNQGAHEFNLTHELNKEKAEADKLFNEQKLTKLEYANRIAALNARLAQDEYNLKKNAYDRFGQPINVFGTAGTGQTEVPAMVDPNAAPDGTLRGNAGETIVLPRGSDAVPALNDALAGPNVPPANAGVTGATVSPTPTQAPSTQYLVSKLNPQAINSYGQGGVDTLTNNMAKRQDAQVLTSLLNTAQQQLDTRFTDLTDLTQLREANAAIERISQNPELKNNPVLASDLKTALSKYVKDKKANDENELKILTDAAAAERQATKDARDTIKFKQDQAEDYGEKQAKYARYKTDFEDKLKKGQWGANFEPRTANPAYEKFDPILNRENILPKDIYAFYQNLANKITEIDADTILPGDVGDIRVTIPDQYGIDQIIDLKSANDSQVKYLLDKYLPDGARPRAKEADKKRANANAQTQVDALNKALNR